MKKAAERGRGPAHLEEGRDALGRPRRARDRQPPRLADDRRADARGGGASSTRSGRLHGRRAHRRRAARHGRLEPRARGASGAPSGTPDGHDAARARLDRRRRDPRRRGAPSTCRRRCSSSRRSRAAPSRRCRSSATSTSADGEGVATRAATSSPITDPGSKLARDRRGARLPARVPERPGHRRALLGAVVLRARARGADGRGRRGRCSTRAQVAEQRCQGYDEPVGNSGPVARLRAGRAGARRAATRPPSSWTSRSARFGLWVEQLIAESLGKEGKGILPVADEPLGDARRLRRRPRLHPPAQLGSAGRRARRRGSRSWRRPASRSITIPSTGRRTSAGSSSSPSSRRPWPAGCWASTRSTSPTCRRPRTTRPRCSSATRRRQAAGGGGRRRRRAARRCCRSAAPPHYVAIMGYVQPSDEFDAAVAGAARR